MSFIQDLKFDDKGLIPAIIQDNNSGQVIMMGYMNEESIKLTIETKKATFFSRSRQKLWLKGETSGHFQIVKEIRIDCDKDTLLILVEPIGPACHTNNFSCFYRKIENDDLVDDIKGENESFKVEL